MILAAYERAAADGFYGTDDASLVERMGIPVRMIPGESDNIKVTTPEDLVRGEIIIRRFPMRETVERTIDLSMAGSAFNDLRRVR